MSVPPQPPPTWWRPSLEAMRLLDTVASDASSPIAIFAGPLALLVPAQVRFPAALLLRSRGLDDATVALLPHVERLTGVAPRLLSGDQVASAAVRTVLRLDPCVPRTVEQLSREMRCLAPGGLLACAVPGGGTATIFRLRRLLRDAGYRRMVTTGYLGPRSLAWSALGRVATIAGRPALYDSCHAAMRRSYTEPWPLALSCRLLLVTARKSGPAPW